MFAAVGLLVLCQQQLDRTLSAEAAWMMMNAERAVQATNSKPQNARAKREFAERFNHLITALKDFE